MKWFLSVAVLLTACLVYGDDAVEVEDEEPAPAIFDKTYNVTVANFEDQVIESDNFVINNFMLVKQRNDYSNDKKLEQVSFGASVKGRSSKSQEVSVMLVGLDEKRANLWTLKATDSMYSKSVGSMQDQVRLPQGTLKRTASIWMRVLAVTNSN